MFKMGMKRTADEVEPSRPTSLRRRIKRLKATPQEDDGNSSEASSCSVSEDSALESSPEVSKKGRNSSMSSVEPANLHDSDTESSISSSESDSSGSDAESDDAIITIGQQQKPNIKRSQSTRGAQDIRERLASFLPQLAEANKLLTTRPATAHNIEDVEDDEQHIEMNLGLGVLEEKSGQSDHSSSSDEDESEEDEEQADAQQVKRPTQTREADRVGRLMGQRRLLRTDAIQDVG